MKLKGSFTRLLQEARYVGRSSWRYDEVGKFWDSVHDYDEIDHETYSYDRRFTDSYEINNLPDGGVVLDICCRTGNGTIFYSEKKKIKKVLAADVSFEFLKIARNKFEGRGINYGLVQFDSLPLPFKDGGFDSVLCFETVEHFPNPRDFIGEIARVCRKGGRVIITMPNVLWEPVHWFSAVFDIHHSEGPHRFIRRRRLLDCIASARLKVKRERTTVLIPNGPPSLLRLGEKLEQTLGERVRRHIALRRIFICEKG